MSPNGYASNIKIRCHAKRPVWLRVWVYTIFKAFGVELPLGFLVKVVL